MFSRGVNSFSLVPDIARNEIELSLSPSVKLNELLQSSIQVDGFFDLLKASVIDGLMIWSLDVDCRRLT